MGLSCDCLARLARQARREADHREDDEPEEENLCAGRPSGSVSSTERQTRIPAIVAPVVDRAMALSPADRFASVEDLRAALFSARARVEERYDATVYVVDDDADMRESLVHLTQIGLPGAEVVAFERGSVALAAASAGDVPDIAIVDLAMPDLNGFELATLLRQGAHPVKHVIVVTGVGGAGDWDLLRHVGASGFLVKPVEPTSLAALLRNLVDPLEDYAPVPPN